MAKTASENARAYKEKNYDRMELILAKGAKGKIKELAAAEGESVNRYVLKSVELRAGVPLQLGEDLPQIAAARQKREKGE